MSETTYTRPTEGYIHGSNLLLGAYIETAFNAMGFSKTCQIQNKAETKDRAHKQQDNTGKWKEKTVTGLSTTITTEGFSCYDENFGYEELHALWLEGKPITLRYTHRGEELTKYYEGKFVITSLDQTAPADDDVTYSVTFENSGAVIPKTV